jgi:hypothetical protein
MSWVAPCLSDGLGNRLFQYACAKSYAEQYNKELVYFLPRARATTHGSYKNMFKLFPETRVLETDVSWNEVEEQDYYKYEHISPIDQKLVIKGSRQSYNYFKDTTICPAFENAISNERLDYLNTTYLRNRNLLFSIHLRLGDYKYLPHYKINLPAYYEAALKLIPENAEVLLFSDEPEVASQIFPNFRVCQETDEVETLYLMSQCLLGSIAANSTFSYWGSYFAHQKNPEHIAVFPYKLMNTEHNFSEYYPPYSKVLKF